MRLQFSTGGLAPGILQEKPDDKTASNEKLSAAQKGVEFCNRLFYEERLYKDLPADERKQKRLETQPQIWKEFWSWLETLSPTGGSKLEKAVNYAFNHKETLMNYLQDGRCEISNNAAERRVKSYVMGRKNFLFHNTVDGARASATVLKKVPVPGKKTSSVTTQAHFLR